MILIESALPFTVMGISTGIIALVRTPASYYAWIFVSRLWTIFSVSTFYGDNLEEAKVNHFALLQALAAQLIIYRVITGISWTSDPQHREDTVSKSMHFAARAPESTGNISGTTGDDVDTLSHRA